MEELINPQDNSVQLFLRRWYGGTDVRLAEKIPAEQWIPPELVAWHAVASSAPTPVTFQNYPVPLSELIRSKDGMVVFWIENQGAYYWAVNPDERRHEVFVRESADDPWDATGESLTTFLLHCTVSEAFLGAQSRLSAVVPERIVRGQVESRFTPLDFHALANEDHATRLFCSHNALARITPPPVGYSLPGDQSWMLTIAVANGNNVGEYSICFDDYLPAGGSYAKPPEASSGDLPF